MVSAMPTLIQESYINATEGHRIGENVQRIEDTIFEGKAVGDIYRYCVREYGRCIGKVYVDTDTGAMAVGWVFVKRMKYEDVNETYLHETWVTLLERDETIRERDYFNLASAK
jgi:hypothetical protein